MERFGTGDGHAAVSAAELLRLTEYTDAQQRKVRELQTTVAELQQALDVRVAIDRAIGMLAERFDLLMTDAFELLRSAARDSRREVRALAAELTLGRGWTPDEIVAARRRRPAP